MIIINKNKTKIIRLHNKGKKSYPLYEILLSYKQKKNKGLFLEKLGFINPNQNEKIFFINTLRLAF
jgi:ribosomal protein S16